MKIRLEDAWNLVSWYEENRRSLPWRDTGNPYDVWLSEIMLQQTRIEAVREKFIVFRQELPDITSLSKVDDDRLMRLWEGLGYYSRARNLKKCAIKLVEQYNAQLPADYEALKKLPGIGPYTAGAIASISFGIPVSAVDGNVLRVLARYFEVSEDIRNASVKAEFEKIIGELFESCSDSRFVSFFNQGIMELGETICVPNGTPQCERCPLRNNCKAHLNDSWKTIPYRSPLKGRKSVNRTLLVIRDDNRFLIHKRDETGLLAGMYEFVGTDGHLSRAEAIGKTEQMGFYPVSIKALPSSKHIFTHLEWHMKAYEITIGNGSELHDDRLLFVTEKELAHLPIPSAFRTITDYYMLR